MIVAAFILILCTIVLLVCMVTMMIIPTTPKGMKLVNRMVMPVVLGTAFVFAAAVLLSVIIRITD